MTSAVDSDAKKVKCSLKVSRCVVQNNVNVDRGSLLELKLKSKRLTENSRQK